MNVIVLSPTQSLIAHATIWIVNVIYVIGVLPQIRLNYKLKTTVGISDFMLFGYFTGYVAQVFFIYCAHLPTAYKVLAPLGCLMIGIIVFQRFYYNDKSPYTEVFWQLYILVGAASILSVPLALLYTHQLGFIAGWLSTFIWALYQLPQAIKIYVEKSVRGFSFWFVTIMACGVFTELIAAILLRLPLPTILNNTRSILAYLIFCLQFYCYHKKSESL